MSRLTDLEGWEALRQEALRKVARNEASVSRLIFRTRSPIPPEEIEFSRGFRQGVMYVIDGLPNEIKAEFKRELAAATKEGDS